MNRTVVSDDDDGDENDCAAAAAAAIQPTHFVYRVRLSLTRQRHT